MLKKLLAAMAMMFAMSAFAAIDVNKATAAELDSIKGIGPGISTKILDERKKGNFKDWNDFIDRTKGVGDGNAAKFSAEGLTVNGSAFAGAPAVVPAAKPVAPAKDAKPAPAATAPVTPAAAKPAAAASAAAAPVAKAASAAQTKSDAKAQAKADKEAAKAAKEEAKMKKAEEMKAKKAAAADAKKAAADAKAAAADAPKAAASAAKK